MGYQILIFQHNGNHQDVLKRYVGRAVERGNTRRNNDSRKKTFRHERRGTAAHKEKAILKKKIMELKKYKDECVANNKRHIKEAKNFKIKKQEFIHRKLSEIEDFIL